MSFLTLEPHWETFGLCVFFSYLEKWMLRYNLRCISYFKDIFYLFLLFTEHLFSPIVIKEKGVLLHSDVALRRTVIRVVFDPYNNSTSLKLRKLKETLGKNLGMLYTGKAERFHKGVKSTNGI